MSTILAPNPMYGRPPHNSKLSLSTFDVSSKLKDGESVDQDRNISRTPNPTPEEYNFLHGIKPERTTAQKIKLYAILGVLIALSTVLSFENKKIVNGMKPATDWLRDHTVGPLIPIAILIIISFPPLFGQELVATLIGITWDLPAAFAIFTTGTLLGEIANFFTFKYACTARGKKLEGKNLNYGLLAYVSRTGGFWVILIIRYSIIPSHYATSVFSTPFWVFLGAAILSLPTQLVTVYVGYAMQPAHDNLNTKVIENVFLALWIVATVGAYIWIKRRLRDATPDFIHARRKARQVNGGVSSHYVDISLPAV
ncbi:hypothetical protein MSAN_01167100 [Mycena sanguinolenta]|uniref:Golgi apparatus membrane protein TVP38 n=1 Tax=Mycena sanguinolenta TaxID=230812 RepID=A0A8H7D3Z7_9AGAR|nr:hypothetical protein MSAN_01167100 [Mycena sanguinolenta]